MHGTQQRFGLGLAVALASAAAFGSAGSVSKALLVHGWSPAAIVCIRLAIAGAVLSLAAAPALRGRWWLLRRDLPVLTAYGVIACAGCQLFYVLAIARLSVGVGLLIEYLAPILLVLLAWARTRRTPHGLTGVGVVASLAGLVCVLDLTGPQRLSLVGVGWALLAAVGLAIYFLLGAHGAAHEEALPPVALAAGGMLTGAATMLLLGLVGVLPLQATFGTLTLLGGTQPWWVPVLILGLVPGALAYWSGIVGARLLGSTMASFVGLTEVLFAVLTAWVLLGERPGAMQAVGGLLILAGVSAVRVAELRQTPVAAPGRHRSPSQERDPGDDFARASRVP